MKLFDFSGFGEISLEIFDVSEFCTFFQSSPDSAKSAIKEPTCTSLESSPT